MFRKRFVYHNPNYKGFAIEERLTVNCRRTSQKPQEELYAAFKNSFPEVGPGTAPAGSAAAQRSASLGDALADPHIPQRYVPELLWRVPHLCKQSSAPRLLTVATMISAYEPVEHEDDDVLTTDHFLRHLTELDDNKDHDCTPKPMADSWRLTPSFMDLNSFAFTSFANQPPGYYTPTPGGVNTFYHSQAGDLHTPGMGMHLGTPLSMPHSVESLQPLDSGADMQPFQPHMINHHPQFHNPFVQQQQAQQQSFAPSQFLQHQDSGYEAMERSPHKLSPQQQQEKFMGGTIHTEPISGPAEASIPGPLMQGGEK